jgi:hypothetical protein
MKASLSFMILQLFLLSTSSAIYNLSYSRNDPTLPLVGTINWERVSDAVYNIFSPRHSHATCTFKCPYSNKTCIWLTGGRTETYRTFDLYYEDRAADIWWSENGAGWNKVLDITDVWSGEISRDSYDPRRFKVKWELQLAHRQAPWAPR